MKKALLFCVAVVISFLFCNCSHIDKKPVSIAWPKDFNYIEAFCEIDVRFKEQQYAGEMSLKVNYPGSIFIEVYGPFGNTVLSVVRTNGRFLMHTENEELTNEKEFYRLFHITIDDIIEDLTFKGPLTESGAGILYKERDNYMVTYYTGDDENSICWSGPEGDFCVKFLEANFSKGESIGKGDRRGE